VRNSSCGGNIWLNAVNISPNKFQLFEAEWEMKLKSKVVLFTPYRGKWAKVPSIPKLCSRRRRVSSAIPWLPYNCGHSSLISIKQEAGWTTETV
jgi:hypothetical protein